MSAYNFKGKDFKHEGQAVQNEVWNVPKNIAFSPSEEKQNIFALIACSQYKGSVL